MDCQNLIEKMNDLYITYRGRYLIQYPKGIYQTADTDNPKYKPLCDGFINNHFKGTHTYGVFAGRVGTKFMTFDVDTKENARYMTMKLVNTLIEEFGVPAHHIHVSLSGSKGYHVDLFFEFIQNKHVEVFYNKVIKAMGVEKSDIELRPTHYQGVKLPLGKHQKTGNRCWFVDTITLEPIKKYDHILTIQPMTEEEFLFIVYGDDGQEEVERQIKEEKQLDTRQKKILEHVASATDMEGKTAEECYQYAQEILELQQLKFPNTRHNTTLLLARYFNSLGNVEKEVAISTIQSIIENTPEDYFSKGHTSEWRMREVERIVNLAYERNYTIEGQRKQIVVSKNEIVEVLKAKTLPQKQILFSMLIHSKRVAKQDGTFYMAYSTLSKMTGMSETNISNMKKNLMALEKQGFIQIISANEVDKTMSKLLGKPYKKPNVYKVLIEQVEGDVEFQINTEKDKNFFEMVKEAVEEEEVKKIVSKSQYYNTFKPMYAEVS
ncbi:hypothetical protein LRS37_12895 [Neobacillus sedimentimangrovi]|uniref:TOTE conflict system primase domain-containing protein n=1 Tax=Neobacillus sedimentimangrovi TaxID=2699460 RepID=A0ABS8QKD2_9BACI|nr:hypothetical protein [Neobacillus sedimentimangrovi]MCD4839747.1 hypothetical protein [Neobacillus sedimentimangrovi]